MAEGDRNSHREEIQRQIGQTIGTFNLPEKLNEQEQIEDLSTQICDRDAKIEELEAEREQIDEEITKERDSIKKVNNERIRFDILRSVKSLQRNQKKQKPFLLNLRNKSLKYYNKNWKLNERRFENKLSRNSKM